MRFGLFWLARLQECQECPVWGQMGPPPSIGQAKLCKGSLYICAGLCYTWCYSGVALHISNDDVLHLKLCCSTVICNLVNKSAVFPSVVITWQCLECVGGNVADFCVLVNETAVLPSVVLMWQCLECVLKCNNTAVFSNVWWLCGLDKGARARCSEKESSIHIKNGGGGNGTTRRRMMRRRRKGGNPIKLHTYILYTYLEWKRRSGCGPTRNR